MLKGVLRFGLPPVGALLAGVYPGLILVAHLLAQWPVFPDLCVTLFVHVSFAALGSFAGTFVYCLAILKGPKPADLAYGLGVGVLVGLLGTCLLGLAYGA